MIINDDADNDDGADDNSNGNDHHDDHGDDDSNDNHNDSYDDGHHDDDGDSYITCEIGFNDKHTQTNKQQLFRIDISIKWLNLSTYLPRIQPSTSNINARHLVNDRDVPRTNTEKPVIRIYNKIIVIDIQRSIMILDQIFII